MRYFVRFALPFCVIQFICCIVSINWIPWLIAGIFAVGFILSVWKGGKRTVQLCVALAGVCLGAGWFSGYSALIVQPAEALTGTESAFTAEVAAYPEEGEYGVSLLLKVKSGAGAGKKVQVWLEPYYQTLKPGDTLRGTIQYESVFEQSNHSVAAKGIFLKGKAEIAEVYAAEAVPAQYWLQALGKWAKDTAQSSFSDGRGALLAGLLTGDKSALSNTVYSNFRRAGMAHLLAVSGLHVGFLTGILFLLPGQRRRRIFVAVPVLVGFALMTGGSSSVWRAVVMTILMLIAPLLNREADPPTSLTFALMILLLQNPYASESVSLQLSFAAVTGLICFYPTVYCAVMRPWETKWRRERLWRVSRSSAAVIFGGVSAACCAVVLTLPLSMWYFESVSLVGPVSNVLSLWVASAAFVGGVFICALTPLFPGIASLLKVPVGGLLSYLLRVAEWLGQGTFSAVRTDNVYLTGWLVTLMLVLAAIVAIKPLRRRPMLPVCCGGWLLFLALTLRLTSVSSMPLTFSALDVGQGSATVMCARGIFVAVDCGGDDAGAVTADYIQSGGGKTLAALVLTHYDSDHINGLEELMNRISVEQLLLPDVEDDSGGRNEIERLAAQHQCLIRWVKETTIVTFGGAKLTIYPPIDDSEDDSDNAECLSVLCSRERFHALITGDMAQEQEQLLLERENLPKLDVLVAGHHGSNHATGAYLLRTLQPDIVIISAKRDNSYGLPGDDALSRMDVYGCEIYRTDENGTITIRCR